VSFLGFLRFSDFRMTGIFLANLDADQEKKSFWLVPIQADTNFG
jgi:hypothetical protein